MGVMRQAVSKGTGWHRSPASPQLLTVLMVALVAITLLAGAAHLSSKAAASRQHDSFQELQKQVDIVKNELKESLEQTRKELSKQIEHSAASWVKDRDIQQVAKVGTACDAYNSSAPDGLHLNLTDQLVAPIVVLAHSRVGYLAKTMITLLKYWSDDPNSAVKFPLYISVDGDHQPTLLLATALTGAAGVQVIRVQRDLSLCPSPWHAYCNLAMHYKMLLQLFFECLKAPRLIFLEEDLQVGPDFFSYFEATAPLLEQDDSLYCISAWNDQGQKGRVFNRTALYRTDVFPGLGWMLTAQVGLELMPTWPPGFWDDNHLRKPHIRKGRQCVFPEVPRTHTFGQYGASNGMFYSEHLSNMALNHKPVDWTKMDLSYLRHDKYAALMESWLSHAHPLKAVLSAKHMKLQDYCNITQPPDPDTSDLYLTYKNNEDFERLGRELAPMLASVSGGAQIPRAVYNGSGHGAVIVRCRQRRLFLVQQPPSGGGTTVAAKHQPH